MIARSRLVRQSKAIDLVLPDIQDVIQKLHEHSIYVIARMATFMQPDIAHANPDLAVMSTKHRQALDGGYTGPAALARPDQPKRPGLCAGAGERISSLGFDEIQFDYIRFPSDPAPGEKWDEMKFSVPVDEHTKPQLHRAIHDEGTRYAE